MDVRRGSGDSGLMYTLVLFVFLFFISAALAVVFYMQADDQRSEAEEARSTLNEVANSADRGTDLYTELQTRVDEGEASSVLGALRSELEGLRSLIAGEADASRQAINDRLAEVGLEETDVLVHTLEDMNNELERLEGQLENADVRASAAEQQLDDLQEQATEEQEEYESRVAELSETVDSLRDDYNSYRDQAEDQQQELSRRLEEARDEAEQEIRTRDNQIGDLENSLAERDSRIRQLIQEMGGETPEAPDPTREHDGRIVDVSDERNIAYIDLGRRDHMVLGMQFEVFDQVQGVEVDEDGELRGKATIEVVDISEKSSAGRIVRSSLAQPVLQGDVVANLVFDRDRQFKFFVFGDFDLDRDGEYSAADRETVLTLIREWGGTVVDPEERRREISARFDDQTAQDRVVPPDVDFVVVGQEPSMPNELPPGERDAVRIQESIQAEEAWEEYNRIVDAANDLGIPVLNENRFLALIGHTTD